MLRDAAERWISSEKRFEAPRWDRGGRRTSCQGSTTLFGEIDFSSLDKEPEGCRGNRIDDVLERVQKLAHDHRLGVLRVTVDNSISCGSATRTGR